MKILFFPADFLPLRSNLCDERPLSGGPTTLIRLAAALSDLGHEVTVLTADPKPHSAKPLYLNYANLFQVGPVDLLITVRGWRNQFYFPFEAKKRFFWTGDTLQNPRLLGVGDPRFPQYLDLLVAKSAWHASTFVDQMHFPKEKTTYLYNGVHLPYFQKKMPKKRKRLIYTSTPNRGLKYLIPIFRKVLAKHPDAELEIYSSFDRMSVTWPPHEMHPMQHEVDPWLEEARKLPNCNVHGSVTQEKLAEAFLQSAVMAYPATFLETCSSSTLEAQAAGCPVVTSATGSLPETVGEGGILIPNDPTHPEYEEKFVAAIDRLFSDDAFYIALSATALARSSSFSWDNRAKQLLRLYENTF